MSFYDRGNRPINSTTGIVSNPSTSSLMAELDSTQLLTAVWNAGFQQDHRVTWIVGVASTVGTWQLEHVLSTGLGSTAVIDTINVLTATGQSAQFVTTHTLSTNSRLRARLNSSVTGSAMGFIQAESLI